MREILELLKKHVVYELFAKLVFILPSALVAFSFRLFFSSGTCGARTVIHSPVILHNINRRNLKVGNDAHIGRDVFIDLVEKVSIGDRTTISMGVKLITHQNLGANRRAKSIFPHRQAEINIGEDVYIGANAIVLMGVDVGNGSVIGAGSLVTRDVPENTLVYGSPARFVKTLPPIS